MLLSNRENSERVGTFEVQLVRVSEERGEVPGPAQVVRSIELGNLGEEPRSVVLAQRNAGRRFPSEFFFLGLELLDVPPGAGEEPGRPHFNPNQDKHQAPGGIKRVHVPALALAEAVQAQAGVPSQLLALDQEAHSLEHAPLVADRDPAV